MTTNPYDQLLAAFADLNRQGFVTRTDFSCCQSCGRDEIDEQRTPRPGARDGEYPFLEESYTFFHQQDTDAILAGNGDLRLNYGVFPGSSWPQSSDEEWDESSLAVGRLVAEALRRHGLEVDWNEEVTTRIAVKADFSSFPLPWVRQPAFSRIRKDLGVYVLLGQPATDIRELLAAVSLPITDRQHPTHQWLSVNEGPLCLRLRLIEPITDADLSSDAAFCDMPPEAFEHQSAIEIEVTGGENAAQETMEQFSMAAILMQLPTAKAVWVPYQHDLTCDLDPEEYQLVSTQLVPLPEGDTLIQTLGLSRFAGAELVVPEPPGGRQPSDEAWAITFANLAHTLAVEGLSLDELEQRQLDLRFHRLGEVAGVLSYVIDPHVFSIVVKVDLERGPASQQLP